MKRAVIIIVGLFVLLIGGLIVAPGFIDWNKYKPQASEQVKKITGYDVDIRGDLSMALIPAPRLFIEDVSVRVPAASGGEPSQDPLLTLERLEINVALLPLLSKEISVNSVSLVRPSIRIGVNKAGDANWMTPEIQTLMDKSKDKKQAQGENETLAGSVSLNDIRVEDGAFYYADARSGKASAFKDIDLEIEAKTLQGPFELEGEVEFSGEDIEFEGRAGKWDKEAGGLSVNMGVQAFGADIKFDGLAGLQGGVDIQGNMMVSVKSLTALSKRYDLELPALAEESLSSKGLLKITPDKASYKDLTLEVGGHTVSGFIETSLSPLNVKGRLSAAEPVNLDDLMPKASSKKEAGGYKAITEMLPETLSLPAAFEADVALSVPALTYKGAAYEDIQLALSKKNKTLGLVFSAGGIPGRGNVRLVSNLIFAEKSVSEKTGVEIYSAPVLTVSASGKTQNLSQTLETAAGARNIPILSTVKTASFDSKIKITPSQMQITQGAFVLDGQKISLSGAMVPGASSGRDLLKVRMSADRLDLESLTKKEPPPAEKADPAALLESFSLPYDLDFDVSVQNSAYDGQKITGFKAEGRYRKNSLHFKNLSVQNFAGAALWLRGGIGDLQALSGLDVNISASAQDPRTLAEYLKMDVSGWPKQLNAAKATAQLKGAVSALDMHANIEAMQGQLILQGRIRDPLIRPSVGDLAVQLRHRNMAEAIALLAPSAPRYASLGNPLDIYAKVNESGGIYALEELKADLAGVSLTGRMTFDGTKTRPKLTGDLQLGTLVLKTEKNTGRSGGRSSPTAAPQPRWSGKPLDMAWMRAFDADMKIVAKAITYENWNLKNPSLALTVDDGVLDIQSLKAGLYGGGLDFSAKLASQEGVGKPVDVSMKAAVSDVSLEDLVRSLVGSPIIKGRGRISMNTALTGAGNSAAALVNSLNGNGTMTGSAITLEGFDLTRFAAALSEETKPEDTVMGLWEGATKGGSTSFDTLDGAFVVQNGIVNIRKMDMDGPKALMATTGKVDLPRWSVETAHKITLKENPEVPPFTINISGPLDNPGQTFAQGALNDYLSRKLNRKLEKLLTDKLGLPSAEESQPQQTAPVSGEGAAAPESGQPMRKQPPLLQEIEPEDVVRDLLKGLLQ